MANTTAPLTAYVLAAGKGTRMRAAAPKSLMPVAGRSIIAHIIVSLKKAGVKQIVVVTAEAASELRNEIRALDASIILAKQKIQTGTARSLMTARAARKPTRAGRALIVFGDTPLLHAQTLRNLARAKTPLALLGFTPDNTAAYGRVVLDNGYASEIIEHKNATAEQRKIRLCNGGAMSADETLLTELLPKITNKNKQGEYLLPDIVALAHAQNHRTKVLPATEDEVMGVDSLQGLAKAERLMQDRLRRNALDAGAHMPAPDTVYFASDTQVRGPLQIDPYVVFGNGVRLEKNCHIKSFSHIEAAVIKQGALLGPFCRVRNGAHVGEGVRLGNFVEVKNSTLAKGVKANHLVYLGDAEIGANTNIGAGAIICNYDGERKHKTKIGRDVFIGSNTSLIAPIELADTSQVAAGTVATRSVPKGALAITRARETTIPNWKKRKSRTLSKRAIKKTRTLPKRAIKKKR